VGGDAVCTVTLFALAFFSYEFTKSDSYKYLVIAFLFAYLIAFQLSLGPITWIYLAEILPEKGVSIAVLFNWIATSIVA
jgi:Na+/melibiose symporter-like transporter